ncbi:MAG: STAS domain-containing protein [Cyclobacteriaceae bacterium]
MVEVNVETKDKYCLIRIDGEVDASSSIHIDEAMQQAVDANCKSILVDCKELHYISSAGLGVFMSYIQVVETKNIQLVLFNMSPKVYKVFEILGLHQLLTIVDTEETAKKDFVQ